MDSVLILDPGESPVFLADDLVPAAEFDREVQYLNCLGRQAPTGRQAETLTLSPSRK